jgi:hypothetical protein
MAAYRAVATIFAAWAPLGLRALCRARSGDENQSTQEANLRLEERAVMSDEEQREENDEFNEDGPGINSDLSSWLYVVGGIPMMILFFVVLFVMVGSCDAQNVMIYG